MAQAVHFETGDRVKHPKRPEWGSGIVRSIQAITHEGKAAQRLTIDFAVRGRTVLNAAMAPLVRLDTAREAAPPRRDAAHHGSAAQLWAGHPDAQNAGQGKSTATLTRDTTGSRSGDPNDDSGWLDRLETAGGKKHELWELPDALTNPFATPEQRLRATLETYKFSTEPRALIAWAIVQTGLDDPLTKYTRPELEQAFPRFARDRDAHLRSIVRDLKRKNDQASIKASMKGGLFPAAQSAIDKALRA